MKTFEEALDHFRCKEDPKADAEAHDATRKYFDIIADVYESQACIDFLSHGLEGWDMPTPSPKLLHFLFKFGARAVAMGVMCGIEMEKQ